MLLYKYLQKCLFAIAIFFLAFSCAGVSYQHIYRNSKGLDFRSGKWLIGYPEGNFSNRFSSVLHNNLFEYFSALGGDSVYSTNDLSFDYIVPDALSYRISAETLRLLGKTTDFKFFVTIKALNKRESLDLYYIEPPEEYGKNESEVFLEVYDIPSGEKIYSQQIIASIEVDEDDDDVKFVSSSGTLILKALKKKIKEVRKYSVF